ncbi:MAG: hypothetical protein ABIQ04_04110 [Candidatus Saccharimonadales bacterium]
MNHYIQTVKNYLSEHKNIFLISALIIVILAVMAALFMYNSPQKHTYKATNACDLFSPKKAQDLLGEKVISVDTKGVIVSGDIATSKCSYTDSNQDTTKLRVAAVAVRSGINEKGIQQNITEFTNSKTGKTVEDVNDIGDKAYFNQTLGQLNVLRGRDWIILSYGLGSAPETNELSKNIDLAKNLF